MTLSQRVAAHLRGNLVGYVAVFIALSGTAIALPGKKSVKSDDLATGAVRSKAIKAGAVKNAKLATGAVTSLKIADANVVSADLANSAVTEGKIADGAVARAKIPAGAINGGKLANGSVNSAKVNDGSLLAEDFAPGQLSEGFVTEAASGTFTLPRDGRLFVTATFVTTCSSPPCTYSVQIDNVDVPGTSLTTSINGAQLTLAGVSGPLAVGGRGVEIESTATIAEPTIAAVLLQ